MQFWLASHSRDRESVTRAWRTVPPFFGISTRSSHSGNPFATSLCMNPGLPMPDGYRSIVIGADPVPPHARQANRSGERRLRHFQRVEPSPQVEQQLGVEARAHLPGVDEVVLLEVADEQRPQTDAPALWVREAADHQLLRRLAFHLQPVRRAAVLIDGIPPLGHDPFPALLGCALPRLLTVQRSHALQGLTQREAEQSGTTLLERQRPQ